MIHPCSLCSQTIKSTPIIDGDRLFCCHGCRTVHAILLSRNELENFLEHPLFKEALQSGVISNPDLVKRHKVDSEQQKIYFEVTDLWCPSCAEVIHLVLLQHSAILACHVDYATDLAAVTYSPRHLSKEAIFQKIASLGYTPAAIEEEMPRSNFSLYLRFGIAAFCALNVMMFAYPLYATYFDYDPLAHGLYFAWLSCVMSLPVITYCAWPIVRRFWNSLLVGVWGMEALVTIGVGASFVYSLWELLHQSTQVYFDSMTVIITFVLLGKILESRAKTSTKHALLRLNRSIPKRGRKQFPDGTESFVPVKELTVGDLVVALAGEKIVLDGLVVCGEGFCDEAVMTGEARPVRKTEGAFVIGGSVLQQGRLIFQVTAGSNESLLQRIIDMVGQDMGHKSAYTRAVDPIVRWFVPAVFLLAAAVGFYSGSLMRSLAVILISCPCAIGIAAPLVESYLMNALASMGVLIRNRNCLPFLGKETHFLFDKTGTITEGEFTLLNCTTHRHILKGMTIKSNHLIARAIARAISEQAEELEVEEITGKGLIAKKSGDTYILGSRSFLEESGIAIPDHETDETTVYFAKNGTLLNTIRLGDRIRKEALDLTLPSKKILLSGDAESVVKKVAKACGFDGFYFGHLPCEKRARILELKEKGAIVCMVGDGVNDAPSLSSAHVGISVASATDLSIQASDILLTTPNLAVLPFIGTLARKAGKIVHQNLFWAFFYNLIGIALAAFGLLSPIFATFAMMMSSVIILINSRRLK